MSKPRVSQEDFDRQARARRISNLRLDVIRLAASPRTNEVALKKMLASGVEGRREAGETGGPIVRTESQTTDEKTAG